MTIDFELNGQNPDSRVLDKIVDVLNNDGVIAYPTDSGYALGCKMGSKKALDKILKMRNLDSAHNFTLICKDLSEISKYAKVDNQAYRLLKKFTPGAYTFILPASSEVPNLLKNPKKKTIGIRIPDFLIPQVLIKALGEPLVSSSLILPDENNFEDLKQSLSEYLEVQAALGGKIDGLILSNYCGGLYTTVIDLTGASPVLLRKGAGDFSWLE